MDTGNINAVSVSQDRVAGSEKTLQQSGVNGAQKTNPAQNSVQQGGQQEQINSIEEANELKDALNEQMDALQTNIGFAISEEYEDQIIVEIRNKSTKELIKQIPPDDMLDIREKMTELTGLLFDKSV